MIIGKVARPAIPPMEEGTYVGICVASHYIGEQQTTFKGKTKYTRQMLLTIEFPGETIEIDGEDKPRQLSVHMAASTSKNGKLRKMASALMARSYTDEEFARFDTDTLLGKAAMFQVAQSEDKAYANVVGWMQLPKGVPAPATETELLAFDVTMWDKEVFEKLPEWVQNKVKNSTEYKADHAPDTAVDFPDTVKAASDTDHDTSDTDRDTSDTSARKPAPKAEQIAELSGEEECPF